MLYDKLIASVGNHNGVVLTQIDYNGLLHHGRVYVMSDDKKKYTVYIVVRDHQTKEVTAITHITTSTLDGGSRAHITVWDKDRSDTCLVSHNLPLYNGVNRPALFLGYQGQSWPKN